MDAERYQRVKRLCQSALDFNQEMREAYLKEAYAGDESLLRLRQKPRANVTILSSV